MAGSMPSNQGINAPAGTPAQENSINIIYEAMKTQLDRQIDRARSIDTKASFIFVNASVLFASAFTITAATVLPSTVHQSLQTLYHHLLALPAYSFKIAFLTLLLIIYALVTLFAYRAYQTSEFDIPPNVANLYTPAYLLSKPDDTMLQMVYYMQKGYRDNQTTIDRKRDAEVIAYKLLLAEYLVVVF